MAGTAAKQSALFFPTLLEKGMKCGNLHSGDVNVPKKHPSTGAKLTSSLSNRNKTSPKREASVPQGRIAAEKTSDIDVKKKSDPFAFEEMAG